MRKANKCYTKEMNALNSNIEIHKLKILKKLSWVDLTLNSNIEIHKLRVLRIWIDNLKKPLNSNIEIHKSI